MITPQRKDIGRKVIYRESGNHLRKKIEEGVLASFNTEYAFVRYHGTTSAATRFCDLEWSNRKPEDTAVSILVVGGKVVEIDFVPEPVRVMPSGC